MKKSAVVLLIITLAACVFAATAGIITLSKEGGPEAAPPPLFSFRDGNFRVVHMTDFHEWMAVEGGYGAFTETETLTPLIEEYIDEVINRYNPDLVVLGGDNIFPLSTFFDYALGIGVKTYTRIAEVFEAKNQYWTLVFGNHDSESGIAGKPDFYEAVKDYPHFVGGTHNIDTYTSFMWQGEDEEGRKDDRVCNFSIPLYGSDRRVAFNLYLLDSGSFNTVYSLPYRYILDNQVEWYLEQAELLKLQNGSEPVPSIMFTHIPLIEHFEAYGQDNITIGKSGGFSPSDTRSSFFEAAFEMGDIRGIFTGHNHYNSITTFYKRDGRKIMMGITPQASADYDSASEHLRCRVIDIKEDGDFITFIDSNHPSYPDRVQYGETLSYGQG